MNVFEPIFIGVTIVVIGGIIVAIAKHITCSDNHPKKEDIVFRTECDKTHKGLEDCIEGKIKRLDEKFDNFREDVKDNFDEVKELIRNGK